MSLIIAHTDINDDWKDQIFQTINGSIGENLLTFEANSEKLPSQINYRFNNVAKVLKMTWNIEIDKSDIVRHILVTMLDITSEVEAQNELDRKNKEFEIIQQLVEISPKKSFQFFKSCDQLLSENRSLLSDSNINLDSIKILFVNTHTLKGASRSLQLKEIANAFHSVEVSYAKILRESSFIDRAKLEIEFELALAFYEKHKQINNVTLGRQNDLSKIQIDRQFLHENFKLLDQLGQFAEIPRDLRSIIHQNLTELTFKIFSSLELMISEVMEQADKIARDLGKEAPNVEYDIDEILITHDQEEAVKNSFIHLIRNALDHGIETRDERIKKGKPPKGLIKISAKQINNEVEIQISDDGAGLDLQKIREKSQNLGLSIQGKNIDEIASLIFATGFSTAEKISLISGRGVGMSAIRQYIEGIGGEVTINVKKPMEKNREIFRFHIQIRFPAKEKSQYSKVI